MHLRWEQLSAFRQETKKDTITSTPSCAGQNSICGRAPALASRKTAQHIVVRRKKIVYLVPEDTDSMYEGQKTHHLNDFGLNKTWMSNCTFNICGADYASTCWMKNWAEISWSTRQWQYTDLL